MTLTYLAMPHNVAAPSVIHDGTDWVDIPSASENLLRVRCVLRLRQRLQ